MLLVKAKGTRGRRKHVGARCPASEPGRQAALSSRSPRPRLAWLPHGALARGTRPSQVLAGLPLQCSEASQNSEVLAVGLWPHFTGPGSRQGQPRGQRRTMSPTSDGRSSAEAGASCTRSAAAASFPPAVPRGGTRAPCTRTGEPGSLSHGRGPSAGTADAARDLALMLRNRTPDKDPVPDLHHGRWRG